MDRRPVLGITMGDPAGVGPEIIVKALCNKDLYEFCKPVVLGDIGVLSMVFSDVLPGIKAQGGPEPTGISSVSEAKGDGKTIEVLAVSSLPPGTVAPGKPAVEGGRAMVEYIKRAVRMIRSGDLDAMVTCPINKALMQEAGYEYEGHTRLLADLTGTSDYVMMLAGSRLRVTLVTIHCALRDVPRLLNEEGVFKTIKITDQALKRDFGIKAPRIAVAALNPHAGEDGLFGREEKDIIVPGMERASKDGCLVYGPFPPDTIFFRAASSEFDVVVSMYHDQGLIPLKLLHFSDGVNVTLGLPIIRTSVDHGTAYDIAGKGKADALSLVAAIKMASEMVKNRESFSRD